MLCRGGSSRAASSTSSRAKKKSVADFACMKAWTAVLFTGSYEVGTRIKQDTLQQHWKLLALEMGGKNSADRLG